MIAKRLLRPDRPRVIPPHFSWIDHQLIRQHRLRECEAPAWALYLFLVTVADAQGLSYYSDASLTRYLKLDAPGLWAARRQLIQADLIAYDKPLYQVLGLVDEKPLTPASVRSEGAVRSIAEVLRQALGGGVA
jgi:hypothetical protein